MCYSDSDYIYPYNQKGASSIYDDHVYIHNLLIYYITAKFLNDFICTPNSTRLHFFVLFYIQHIAI